MRDADGALAFFSGRTCIEPLGNRNVSAPAYGGPSPLFSNSAPISPSPACTRCSAATPGTAPKKPLQRSLALARAASSKVAVVLSRGETKLLR